MPETPEQKARRDIDAKLIASGWLVQSRDDLDLTAGRGIAVREFPMKSGFAAVDVWRSPWAGAYIVVRRGANPGRRNRVL